MTKDYLRNRPFLTVQLTYQPAPGVDTGKRGWQDKPGAMRTMERVAFVDRVSKIERLAVVIDIINSQVVKNTSNKSDDEVIATYLSQYRDQTTAALTEWARREADRMRRDG